MADALEPVSGPAGEQAGGSEPGLGLAVSGGGYRAMLFHLGSFLRLFELGLLHRLDRISSVSGGSITAAKIGLEWPHLKTRDDFMARVVAPVRGIAGISVDWHSVLLGLILPGGVGRRVSNAYRRHLFGDATLQDLPDGIRFVINATNLETGKSFRFSRPYLADYLMGMVENPRVPLADAVAASSAFPPVLSPFLLEIDPALFVEIGAGVTPAMLGRISLTDGGVYDNLGLETVLKFQTLFVSDASRGVAPDPDPKPDWARLGLRAFDIIYGQVASLRKREVVASYQDRHDPRTGTYWGIRTDISHYGLADALPAPVARTAALAAIPTKLRALDPVCQERLINWGYGVTDAAVRTYYLPGAAPPAGYPYPASGV